jgi:archaellum component FlaC
MSNKEIIDFDFCFSFIDDEIEEVKKTSNKLQQDHQDLQKEIKNLQHRLEMLHRSIVPFLDNLCKNPEKSTIYWPDRVKKIEAYKDKLLSIVEGN